MTYTEDYIPDKFWDDLPKGATSCRTLASGGLIHPITACFRYFVNMNVVGTRRKHAGRYTKWRLNWWENILKKYN